MKIFSSPDLTVIIKRYIKNLPRNGRGEVTRIAASLGVSTTLVSQVLNGERFFTPEQGQRLCSYLGLSALETDHILFIIQRDRAATKELKNFWTAKLETICEQAKKVASRVSVDRELTDQEKAIFYSSPIYSAICLFVTIGERGKSIIEIAERFEMTRAKTSEMLRFLTKSGLCVVEDDHYKMGLQKTHLEADSPFLARYHSSWRLRAIQRSENLGADELMYTAPVSLSKKDFDILREELVIYIQNFLKRVHDSPAEEVACLNLDFLWVTK